MSADYSRKQYTKEEAATLLQKQADRLAEFRGSRQSTAPQVPLATMAGAFGNRTGPVTSIQGKGAYSKSDPDDALAFAESFQKMLMPPFVQAPKQPMILRGMGDYAPCGYAVKQNSMIVGSDPPEIRNIGDGRVIIRHREYLQDILTSATAGAFQIQNFPIQPGLEESFPWLSVLAQNFEQYRVQGIVYEFKSTSANALNSTNTALGTVILGTEYDSTRPNFVSKMQMENHQFSNSARQSVSVYHPIECARDQSVSQELYIRQGALAANTDQRLYDFGNFQIATVGGQGSQVNIGELWVTYEIELIKPQMLEIGNEILLADHFKATGNLSNTAFFGSNFADVSTANLGCTLTGTQIIFPSWITSGSYQVTYVVYGNSTAVATPTITYTNINALNILHNDTTNVLSNGGQTTTQFFMTLYVTIAAVPGAQSFITFTSGTGALPTSPTAMDLVICAFDNNITT